MELNKKILLGAVLASIMILPVSAVELDELTSPKTPAYRVGISELPENQYIQAKQAAKIEKKYIQINGSEQDNIADRTYADLSIKNLSREVAQDLEFEEQDMLSDLSLLWQGAAMQSDTINFALYKLANPDADKPDEKSIKNVLKTIASMSTLVGASMGNPILAGSSLIGGNIFGIMSQDTKALNYKYTRVTDADMIILIRKIEDLQQNAVDLYYDYMSAKKHLDYTNKLVDECRNKYNLAQQNEAARELVVITDAYYRTALDKQRTAKSEFFSKRAALEQFVGNETFVQFEEELIARENGENTRKKQEEEQQVESQETETLADASVNTGAAPELDDVSNIITQTEEEIEDVNTKLPDLRPLEDIPNVVSETVPEAVVEVQAPVSEPVLIVEQEEEVTSQVDEEKALKELEKQNKKNQKLEQKAQKQLQKAQKAEQERLQKEEAIAQKEAMKTAEEAKKAEEKAKLEEAKRKAMEKRKDPTKGLIFLHGQDKTAVSSPSRNVDDSAEVQVSAPVEPVRVQQNAPKLDIYGLPPLDAIRVPDLKNGGYSIHSELSR